jgi:hypothetical protein
MHSIGEIVAFALLMGLIGLAILIVLWPGEKQGRRVLARWGIGDPDGDEVAAAVTYLRRGRFWYPWLYLGLPPLLNSLDFPESMFSTFIATLLAGGLLAELLAQRPARGSRREAVLKRRGILDFVPVWAIVVSAVTELGAVAHLIVVASWTRLWLTGAALAVSWLIVLLAVRRPSTGSARADLALRRRSTHVALGLGIGSTAGLSWTANNLTAFLAFMVSLVAFIAIASPPGKRRPVGARAD